jgi:glycerol uptake facilitator-like aquaporin
MALPSVTFTTSEERLTVIDSIIKDSESFKDRTDFINKALDRYVFLLNGKIINSFFNEVVIPAFLVIVIFSLYLLNQSIIMAAILIFSVLYLVMFIIVFIRKYKGVRWVSK